MCVCVWMVHGKEVRVMDRERERERERDRSPNFDIPVHLP